MGGLAEARTVEGYVQAANPPDPRTRKRRKVVKDETVEQPNALVPPSGDVPMTVDDFEEDENLMHEEMRILVKVRLLSSSDPRWIVGLS